MNAYHGNDSILSSSESFGEAVTALLSKRDIEDRITAFHRQIKEYPFCKDDGSLKVSVVPEKISYDEASSEYVIHYSDYHIARRKKAEFSLDEIEYPVLLKNIFDKDTIMFLSDNLRDSLNCAADNHLYLYYDDAEAFLLMICFLDIDEILETKKAVFLIGKENRSKYPLDFKKECNIDYSLMEPSLLRPDECKRMCYFYKGTFSGADFVTHVMGRSDDVILVRLWNLHRKSKILGEMLHKSDVYKNFVNETEKKYKKQDVIDFLKENKEKIWFAWNGDDQEMSLFPGADSFIELVDKIIVEPEVTVADLFKTYFIAKDYFVNPDKSYNYRLAPCLLFEPHIGSPSVYVKIFETFKYKSQMAAFRDPLKRQASGIRRPDVPPYGLNLPLLYAQTSEAPYYSIKFEELKLYPEIICRAMCKKLNIAFSKKMLSLDYSEKSTFGKTIVSGYDIQPVIRPVDDCLGIFDQLRLRLFFRECSDYFGYPSYFNEELSDEAAESLFNIPFKIYYNLDEKLSEEEKDKAITRLRNKYGKNYIRKSDEKRVRDLDTDMLPEIIGGKNTQPYRGAISVNGVNIYYDETSDSLFRLLDGYLLSFAKNNDLTFFRDRADLDIIERNILKLVDLFNEQTRIFGEEKVPVQLLYELTNTNIKLEKMCRK